MSPSEEQLRAALRAGEGAAPDPDTIIGRGLQVRHQHHQRRMRIAGMAAAAVVVAGIGVGIAASSNSTARDSAAPAAGTSGSIDKRGQDAAPHLPIAASESNGVNNGGDDVGGSAGVPSASPGECPSTPVRYALAGGGGTNQFGANESLFSGAVASIRVCRYGAQTDGAPFAGVDVLTGTAAQNLATRLDASTATAQSDSDYCAMLLNIELIPAGADGNAMTPITVSGGCRYGLATNGTAVRYVPWTTFVGAPTPTSSGVLQPGGGEMSASPPR